MSADSGSPGPTYWKDTSNYAYRDSSQERKRGSPSTESRVRYPLLFSRTTDIHRVGQIRPEVIANVRHLPFRDRSCAFLYAGHVLEHVYIDQAPELLAEWWRVLMDGGT